MMEKKTNDKRFTRLKIENVSYFKISILACGFMLLILCGCDPYVYQQPYNYADSKWICKKPAIAYYVVGSPEEEDSYSYAVVVIDGQEVELEFGFQSVNFSVQVRGEEAEVLSGTCRYSKKQFTVTVDQESDQLFNGQYDTLVFERAE